MLDWRLRIAKGKASADGIFFIQAYGIDKWMLRSQNVVLQNEVLGINIIAITSYFAL